MGKTNQQKKAEKKRKQKEAERKKRAQQNTSANAVSSLYKQKASDNRSVIQINRNDTVVNLNIDIKQLTPPQNAYNVDCFNIKKYLGYSELYFGNKNPTNRDGQLLHTVIVRISNRVINELIIKSHKDFYDKLFQKYPIQEDYKNHFGFKLESQFPVNHGDHIFCTSNFVYGAFGNDDGELMFYKISPSYIHHILSGKPSILQPNTTGIEGVLTVMLPIQLLSYIYYLILDEHGNDNT